MKLANYQIHSEDLGVIPVAFWLNFSPLFFCSSLSQIKGSLHLGAFFRDMVAQLAYAAAAYRVITLMKMRSLCERQGVCFPFFSKGYICFIIMH